MTIRFDGRVAIVTGAGSGLGRDYATELAKRGAKVVVNDLGGSGAGTGASHRPADAVVNAIRSAGGEAVASHDSVATRSGGEAIVRTALDAFGRVDIVINNAGFLRNNRFEDLSDSQIDAIVDVHLKGAFYVSQPAYRVMAANKYGRFIFTGSASAMFGHAWQANYAAAKGGLMGLSHIVAIEGSAHGIHSNLMLPNANSRLADEMTTGFHEIPEFVNRFKTRTSRRSKAAQLRNSIHRSFYGWSVSNAIRPMAFSRRTAADMQRSQLPPLMDGYRRRANCRPHLRISPPMLIKLAITTSGTGR